MKTLKFVAPLVPLVLSGAKTTTWRLFDDKDLQIGDELSLINRETGQEFARAQIVKIQINKLGDIDPSLIIGHEKFSNRQEMINNYKLYYGDKVDENAIVKIIDFVLRK